MPRILGDAGRPASLLRCIIACVRLLLCIAVAAWAALPALAAESAATAQNYSVVAGELRNALDSLATQGDIQIVYDPALVAGKRTNGVSGRFTAAEALKQLLAGTDLNWKTINAATFVLEPAPVFHPPPSKTIDNAVDDKPRTLNAVTVSGSLIDNANIQTATPTYTITASDIRTRGFNNLAEVLQNSVLATGSVQGPQAARTFTQGAQPVSLFGLGPQLTLILLDGKPVANFGRLYNGTINFTSVANFPLAMIDHIDVMPGGASSIYGSQAIGGVINIVTRTHMQGGEVSVRTGGYVGGAGANQRISGVYGRDVGKWQLLMAAEFDNASPIWGYQRELTAHDTPPAVQAGILDYGTASSFTGNPLTYLSPLHGCANQLFGGSTTLVASHAPPGLYCGSPNLDGYTTYSNQLRNLDGMLKLAYRLTDQVRLYGDAMVNSQQQRWFSGVSSWFPDDLPHGLIEDASTGHYLYLERFFAPEEMPGGAAGQMDQQNDLLYQADIGANGRWGDSGWNWDIYYLRSGDRTKVTEDLLIKPKVDAFFNTILGPVVSVDPHTGVKMYNPAYSAFFQAITPAQYASFSQSVDEPSNTWINDTRATLSNASLFALPGGDAGFAALIEGGSEAWHEPVNPLFTQNDIFEHAATGGGGRRFHAASAFELNLPLLKMLTLDLSGRYDYYALDEGSDNRKFTYKIGLEYRPLNTLLIRGNYTTSFKAPDLSSIFLGPTDYYTLITDYYQCAQAHSSACGTDYQYSVQGTTRANPHLQPTSAQSWDFGTVWSPIDQVELSLDYLHIAIQNEVVQQDIPLLMQTDAQCLLGQRDPNSSECRGATSQVMRAGSGGPVTGITTYYANLSNEVTKSIMGSARYRFALFNLGTLDLRLDYNDMLKHDYQIAPGQPPINNLANAQYSTEFKSIANGSITWTSPGGHWTGTLYGHRYGPSPNFLATNNGIGYPGAGRLPPWITFNASATYRPTRRLAVSLLINNIANKMPPRDASYVLYPYFNNENYTIYGREIMLQADVRLHDGH
ncbi:TonB-dependent receptor domain-containing protein [Dyella humi]|uniref:TonB-dependent receptor n=1 Tax=Dyella humi TaxID=1770547 RepID=A0ABW8IMZ2_9GAMM